MLHRRHFLSGLAALAAAAARPVYAQDRYDQNALLAVEPFGNVTLMHLGGLHDQLAPLYRAEPARGVALSRAAEHPPYLTAEAFRTRYGIGGRTPMDYATTHEAFTELAQYYGPMGGIERIATVLGAIRKDRPEALFLVSGDQWPGSQVSLESGGADVMALLQTLGCDTAGLGSEITLGTEVLAARISAQGYPTVAQNVTQDGAAAAGLLPYTTFMRAGHKIAVIGQAPAHPERIYPAHVVPPFEFGMALDRLRTTVEALRVGGAAVIVCISQNGLGKDMQLARLVGGIDVILSGGDMAVTPEPEVIGTTHVIASGGQGRFVSRLDLAVTEGAVQGIQHNMVPVFSDLITPDVDIGEIAQIVRAPFDKGLDVVVGKSAVLLSRGGTFESTWDSVICQAMMQAHGVEIALCAGVQWGPSILPGQPITRADIHNVSAVTYGQTGVVQMTGAALLARLEASAEGVFAADPMMRSGLQMLRAGGLRYSVTPEAASGQRITQLALYRTGQPIDPARSYDVAIWGLPENTAQGPALSGLLMDFIWTRTQVGDERVSLINLN